MTATAKVHQTESRDKTAALASRDKIAALARNATVQKKVTVRIAHWMEQLRAVLDNINARLQNHDDQGAQALESAAMILDRISQVNHASQAATEMLKNIEQALDARNQGAAQLGEKLGDRTEEIVDLLKLIQEDQQKRMRMLMERSRKTNRLMAALLVSMTVVILIVL